MMQDFSDSCRIIYKGEDLMHNMSNYIKMVAKSMAMPLSDEASKELAHELARSRRYGQLLEALELKIKDKYNKEGY